MTRVVLIGNSHLGALARAARRLRKRGILVGDVAFFGIPSHSYHLVEDLGDGRIGLPESVLASNPRLHKFAEKVNGSAYLSLRSDDVCVVVGATRAPRTIADLVAGTAIDGWREIEADQLLSEPTFEALVDGILEVVEREHFWRCVEGRPFYFVQGPRAPESVQDAPLSERNLRSWRRFSENHTGINRIFDYINGRIDQRLSSFGGKMISQPKGTLAESGLTFSKFAEGRQNLAGETYPSDGNYMHMNNVYGRLVLRKILTVIEKRHGLTLLGEATDNDPGDETLES